MRRISLLIVALFVPVLVLGYSTGPPAGYAGDPPANNNCTSCHTSFPVNSGDGTLQLNELATYTPGETYTMIVSLTDNGQMRWGFQAIVKDENAALAGEITVTQPSRTQMQGDYIEHTSAGTNAGEPGGNTWEFDWTAPAEGAGTVTFYVAGNAANNNGNWFGDYIYTISLPVEEHSVGVDERDPAAGPQTWSLANVYPNPFNSRVTVTIDAGARAEANVAIYDVLGRLVETLHAGALAAGRYTLTWQPHVGAGTYFLRASNENGWSATRRLIFVK